MNLFLKHNASKTCKYLPCSELTIHDNDDYVYRNTVLDIASINRYATNDNNIPYGLPEYTNESDINNYVVNFDFNGVEGYIRKDKIITVATVKPGTRNAIPHSTIHLCHEDANGIIKTAFTYYKKYMLNDDVESNKVGIYLYDNPMWYKHSQKVSRHIDTIYLDNNTKRNLIADIDKFVSTETKNTYESLGINYKRTYMFEGIPGSGKTSLIYAIASKYNKKIAVCNFSSEIDDITFINMLKDLPEDSILVIEDIDCIFQERKSHDEHKNMITFSGLLNGFDGVTTPNGLITIITSNYKDRLDSALIRPGRVDYIIKFDNITVQQVKQMFKRYMFDEYTEAYETAFVTSLRKASELDYSTCVLQSYLLNHIKSPKTAIAQTYEIMSIKESFTKKNDVNMHN